MLSRMTFLLMCIPAIVQAQMVGPEYTLQQAERGRIIYQQQCLACHGEGLKGAAFGPSLVDADFLMRWGNKSLDQLLIHTATTMPTASPGSLPIQDYTDIIAYLIQSLGINPGDQELPSDPGQLDHVIMPVAGPNPSGGLRASIELPPAPERDNPLDSITPVTDEMLVNPPEGSWLTWRRGLAAQGFSPLNTINKSNINELGVAWTWTLPNGANQVTPLVHDGVIFINAYSDRVQALDARTGELLWQYSRWLPDDIGSFLRRKRSFSIYQDRIFIGTADGHVVALDVHTGEKIWDTKIADLSIGQRITGGTLVAEGRVMIGTSGSAPGGNDIVALNVNTGDEAWRFHVIARPGDPNDKTWNAIPLQDRNGGSVWVPGSYDHETGLAYFGTGQTYDTGPLLHKVDQPGISNEGLYMSATVALDPETGEMVWYYQHMPNDQWDLDWAFERTLMTLPVAGIEKKIVVTAGKQAIFDLLEADTGKYIASMDLGLENLVTSIDRETGIKTIDPEKYPGGNKPVYICPHPGGAKNWIPGSYNPQSRIIYMPLAEICMDMIPVKAGQTGDLSSGVRWTIRPPKNHDGLYGRLQAINMATGEDVWIDRQRAPRTTGVLATAGGLVFSGDLDRYFTAYDDASGDRLWQMRLNDVPNTAPISFSIEGEQYIAMTVGQGGPLTLDRTPLVPEIRLASNPGATLWVFKLR